MAGVYVLLGWGSRRYEDAGCLETRCRDRIERRKVGRCAIDCRLDGAMSCRLCGYATLYTSWKSGRWRCVFGICGQLSSENEDRLVRTAKVESWWIWRREAQSAAWQERRQACTYPEGNWKELMSNLKLLLVTSGFNSTNSNSQWDEDERLRHERRLDTSEGEHVRKPEASVDGHEGD